MTLRLVPLKRFVDPSRPITYGIVQAGEHVPDGVPYIRPVDMTNNDGIPDPDQLLRTSPAIAATYSRSEVRSGDLVVSIGPSFGKVMIVPDGLSGANLTQGTARVAPAAGVVARWLYWALQSNLARSYWSSAVGGATFRALNLGPLAATPLPVTDSHGQSAVADFLERESVRIDATITARLQLVERLRERWVACVSRFTDNPSWPQMRLKRLLDGPLEYGIGEPAEHDEPGWPRYIRTTDVTANGDLRKDTFKSLPPEIARPYLLHDGDLLFTRSGATVGKSFVYRKEWGPACFAGYLVRAATDRSKALPKFLSYFAQSEAYWSQIKLFTLQATIQNVSAERYGDIVVRVPTVAEQEQVVAELREVEGRTSSLRRQLIKQVALLREHRQALISAAVTGEIDTVGAAA